MYLKITLIKRLRKKPNTNSKNNLVKRLFSFTFGAHDDNETYKTHKETVPQGKVTLYVVL
jgi:hypothetical protein